MNCLYQEYEIESFEVGRELWHARTRRADRGPLVIDGHAFPAIEVGFAWPSPDAAVDDAKHHIDHFGHRWTTEAGRQRGLTQTNKKNKTGGRLPCHVSKPVNSLACRATCARNARIAPAALRCCA